MLFTGSSFGRSNWLTNTRVASLDKLNRRPSFIIAARSCQSLAIPRFFENHLHYHNVFLIDQLDVQHCSTVLERDTAEQCCRHCRLGKQPDSTVTPIAISLATNAPEIDRPLVDDQLTSLANANCKRSFYGSAGPIK